MLKFLIKAILISTFFGQMAYAVQQSDEAPAPAKAKMVDFGVPPSVITGEDRDQIIQKVQDNLNAIRSLKATFVQRGPEGNVDEGTIYIERPGKIRFEYSNDNPILVVSNGDMLSFIDYEINQVSRWPIDKTPLSVLVNDQINLKDKEIEIPEIIRFAGLIKMSVVQPDQKDQGFITLIFEESTMELKSWEVIDVQGYTTRVALVNPEYNIAVDEKEFTFNDPRPQRNRGPRR
ncbi:MAG: outer membrane lipoprotein carrier protein LolA [Emcibacteraceae bacterium]